MRKYNIKRDIAYYEGMMIAYMTFKQIIIGELNKQINITVHKIDDLEKELKDDTNS